MTPSDRKILYLTLTILMMLLLISPVIYSLGTGHKSVYGEVKLLNGSPANHTNVTVHVNVTISFMGTPYNVSCHTVPGVFTASDGTFSEDLFNLVMDSDGSNCADEWNWNDTIWATADGSTVIPTAQGNGTSEYSEINCSNSMPNCDQSQDLGLITLERLSNEKPNITGIPDNQTPEDTAPEWEIDLWLYATDDYDNDGNLTFAVSSQSNSTLIDCFVRANQYLNCSKPGANLTGYNDVTVNVTDRDNASDIDIVRINVTPVNDAPYWQPITASTDEDTNPPSDWINLHLYGLDLETESSSLSYNLVNQSNSSLIDCIVKDTAGTRYLNCSTPAANQSGISIVFLNVSDGVYSKIGTAEISVTEVNDPPYWKQTPPNQTISEDSGINILLNLSGYGSDIDNATGELSYVVSSEDTAKVDCEVLDSTNLTATPAANYTGNNSFSAQCGLRISDGIAQSEEFVFYLNITPVQDPPYLSGISLNQSTGRTATPVEVGTSGAGDIDGDPYYLMCGNESGNYNLCSSSLGSGERSCSFASEWTDDSAHTVYCILNDTFSASGEFTTVFTADNTAPGAQSVNNLEGDTAPKYWDTDDDLHTVLQLDLAESNMSCRWGSSDQNYSQMSSDHECVVAGTLASCELNVTVQTNSTTRYVSCRDFYGNEQTPLENIDVDFGVDWTIPDVTNTNDGSIHVPGYNVTLTIKDMPEGSIVDVWYCNDTAGTCMPYTSWTGTNGSTIDVEFSQRGVWYLRWNATDRAGNTNLTNQTRQTVVFINTLPVISQEYQNHTGHVFTVNATVSDSVGSSQAGSYSCQLYHRSSGGGPFFNITMELAEGAGNEGTYAANLSTSYGYSPLETVQTYTNCTDGLEYNISSIDSNDVPNYRPTAPSVVVVPPVFPKFDDDLFCNITSNSTDPDGDNITYFYNWYLNGAKTTITDPYLAEGNTSAGEYWRCNVTPYDGYQNGTAGHYTAIIGNNPPVFNSSNPILSITWYEDTVYDNLTLLDHFYDIDGNDLFFYHTSISDISIGINQTSSEVTFTPDQDWYGVRYIRFNATDLELWSGYSNEVTLQVLSVNDEPVINSTNRTVDEDTTPPSNWIDLHNYSSDADHAYSSLSYTLISQSNESLINCSIVSNRYVNCSTPAPDLFGRSELNVSVSDGSANDTADMLVNVLAVNDAPAAVGLLEPPTGLNTTNVSLRFDMNDSSDADNDSLTYYLQIDDSIYFLDVDLDQNITDSEWTLLPGQNLSDSYWYWRVVVCDDSGASNNCTFSLDNFTFTLDRTPPLIDIDEPDPSEILGWQIPLLSEIDDELLTVSRAWYEINNASGDVIDSGNLSAKEDWDITWNSTAYIASLGGTGISAQAEEGGKLQKMDVIYYFNYTVHAYDTLDNYKNKTVSFIVDQSIPSVNIIYPDADNLSSSFNVTVMVQSANLSFSWFNITNASGYSMYSNRNDTLSGQLFYWRDHINITGWSSGRYNLTAFGQDASGNNRTVSTYFNVDVDAPYLSSYDMLPDIVYNNDTVFLNVTWLDNNIVSLVVVAHNASGTWQNVTATILGNLYYIEIASSLLENQELVAWNSSARDNFGNWNLSAPLFFFNVSNRAPVFVASSPVANQTWTENTNRSFSIAASFQDPDGDTLAYSSSSVENITVLLDTGTGSVKLLPDPDFVGIRYIIFYADDGLETTAGNNVTLNVTNLNSPPYFDPALPANMYGFLNETFSYDANATDPDPTMDTLTFYTNNSLYPVAAGTGVISFTPNSTHTGSHPVNFSVCDNHGACDHSVVTFTVGSPGNLTFYVMDALNLIMLEDVTVTGGATCASGCTFDYNITLTEPEGEVTLVFNRTGFTTNTSVINVSGNAEYNITLADIQSPVINTFNLSPSLVSGGSRFVVNVIVNTTDNFMLENVTFNYTLSSGYAGSYSISLDNYQGDIYNRSIGPFNATFLLNSTITSRDSYGNQTVQENIAYWFVFVPGANVSVNAAPVLDPIGDQELFWNSTFWYDVNASDSDGDPLTFSDNATFFDINASDGRINFTANSTLIGAHDVVISVTDGLLSDSEKVTFSVITCGDGTCNFGETKNSCPGDCGVADDDDGGGGGGKTRKECNDGRDNDGDGLIDLADPGCESIYDDDEGDECIEDWQCTDWFTCRADGTQKRNCYDLNSCGTESQKPAVLRNCTYTPTCYDRIRNQGEEGVDCGGPCEPCEVCSSDQDCAEGYECVQGSCLEKEKPAKEPEEEKPGPPTGEAARLPGEAAVCGDGICEPGEFCYRDCRVQMIFAGISSLLLLLLLVPMLLLMVRESDYWLLYWRLVRAHSMMKNMNYSRAYSLFEERIHPHYRKVHFRLDTGRDLHRNIYKLFKEVELYHHMNDTYGYVVKGGSPLDVMKRLEWAEKRAKEVMKQKPRDSEVYKYAHRQYKYCVDVLNNILKRGGK
ncbi:tandem-95 repeat protein [Candidatus Woesearchaeota archaeon]|nr:tandem-95 repeat protein [Candidatus Woesearchaeota archaeon]